jgi:ATP-dependent protease HslVU (ClpYQ) peptidase subunit
MTTIVGLQLDDKSIIAADSRITDHSGQTFSHPDAKKISERGAFLIAGMGEVMPCDVIQHIWTPLKVTIKDKQDLYHFMISKVTPSMRACLKENGYNFDENQDSGDTEQRFTFLISVAGELFEVDQDLSVCRKSDGIYGIGSGGAFAVGALHAGATPIEALEIASKVSAYTAPPFIIEEQFKD